MNISRGALIVAIMSVLIPENAWAYLDPGAGASLIAILAGGFTGLVVVMKMWRAKVAQLFSKKSSQGLDDERSSSDNNVSESPDQKH